MTLLTIWSAKRYCEPDGTVFLTLKKRLTKISKKKNKKTTSNEGTRLAQWTCYHHKRLAPWICDFAAHTTGRTQRAAHATDRRARGSCHGLFCGRLIHSESLFQSGRNPPVSLQSFLFLASKVSFYLCSPGFLLFLFFSCSQRGPGWQSLPPPVFRLTPCGRFRLCQPSGRPSEINPK